MTPPDAAYQAADAGQGPIKCAGQLGSKDTDFREEWKGQVDDCQEDQDGVLGLRGGLIYKKEGL